jgi:hypothetical protein
MALRCAALVATVLVTARAGAQNFASVTWTYLGCAGSGQDDPAEVGGVSDQDIVCETPSASTCTGSHALGFAEDADFLYLRVRLEASPRKSGTKVCTDSDYLSNGAWGWWLDYDGVLSRYEVRVTS